MMTPQGPPRTNRLRHGVQFMLVLSALMHSTLASIVMDTKGCGVTKECLLKPTNCDPNLDCTLGIILSVAAFNKLSVQMVAHSLLPLPPLQYIAVGFSRDAKMGDDFVTECVLNPSATQSAFNDVEVYASYNRGHSNDRTYLTKEEHSTLYPDGVEGGVVDGRLICQFTQQIMPQMSSKNGLLWNLNSSLYILSATGSAQHDEVNAHDLTRNSFFYPLVSPHSVKLSALGPKKFPLASVHPNFHKRAKNSTATQPENSTVKSSPQTASGSISSMVIPAPIMIATLLAAVSMAKHLC